MKTRKHFTAMAKILSTLQDYKHRRHLAVMNAENFAKDNPRFDKNRFFRACGLPQDIDEIDLTFKQHSDKVLTQ